MNLELMRKSGRPFQISPSFLNWSSVWAVSPTHTLKDCLENFGELNDLDTLELFAQFTILLL
eukprot:scaffold46824_cov18-Tisochrysis_lutea.AAC.1